MSDVDWELIRKFAISEERPPEWPQNVRAISLKGLTLFGLDEEHRLYWDGNRVEVRNRLSLTLWQRVGAVIIAGSTFVGALAAVASAIADWKAL